jgi:hypothetical protein
MTERVSRPYALTASPELYGLMAAIDLWIKAEKEPTTLEDAETQLGGLLRSVRFGDQSRDCGTLGMNYPHSLAEIGSGAWKATYACQSCGSIYTCSWADSLD